MKIIILLILLWFLLDCTGPTVGIYNHDLEQDLSCYSNYGGIYGYCDRRLNE